MSEKVLIANRGAIACRVIRTLKRLEIASVAVHSDADRDSLHVRQADEAVAIGPAQAALSYLDPARIIEAARATGASAIHPGYGFLSENADFAEACEAAGIAFLGPTPAQMRLFGLKHSAREQARRCGVPMLPGTGILASLEEARRAAEVIGYPVMLKSTAGGGGIGMRRCDDALGLAAAWESVAALAAANFKDPGLFLEKLVARARHVEVQVFGDGRGGVIAFAERDCSAQRRNQKVIEETPAPGLPESVRQGLREAAVALAASVSYRSAGTVEFVLDADTAHFWFLEVNTRLQVEHAITEEIHGVDLVEWMVRLGNGTLPALDRLPGAPRGAAIQARLYAEDPARGFAPSAGLLTEAAFPEDVRVETWVEAGAEVTAWYDPMIAKIIVHAASRAEAIRRLDEALARTRVSGISTNAGYLRHILSSSGFASGRVHTGLLKGLEWSPRSLEVVEPGFQTTVQDWPGRQGLWDVGIPPSGPMDALSFRLGNAALGNPADAAGLEFVHRGPVLRAHVDTVAILCGADFGATLDGTPIAPWEPFHWRAGSVLRSPRLRGEGARGYLLVRGGLDVPAHLGSRSTFTLGRFGGQGGRALRTGDQLALGATDSDSPAPCAVPGPLRPAMASSWEIGVLAGPHAAPDFFLPEDLDDFHGSAWSVHHNSDRTGIRLVGPKPRWARPDGGEAGLHPSNIHDSAYVVGTIDFTGDTPIILGPDGPSLGGFACPATIALAELWKIGQLSPGSTLRFSPMRFAEARARHEEQERALAAFVGRKDLPARAQEDPARPLAWRPGVAAGADGTASGWRGCSREIVLHHAAARGNAPDLRVRQQGDDALLFEFGPMTLDIGLRLRAQVLLDALTREELPGILDATPGIRSLQVRFDPRRLGRDELLDRMLALESALPPTDSIEIENRIVHLPLSWDDPATRLAIEKYASTVRGDAPWCPSNIEFIRRINGLASEQEVQDIVFAAEYLVLGLGDVYLGAPVATPLDPRHRLVTTKYNPARTWTPENAVGIGGAYLCVYGMEGPGGYQFVGRTVQMWNRWRRTEAFEKPWLLRFFDVLRFYPVGAEELLELREEFPRGRWSPRIERSTFRWADYRAFLDREGDSIERFRSRQRRAFAEERARWEAAGSARPAAEAASTSQPAEAVPQGCEVVHADLPGVVWKVLVEPGRAVSEGEPVAILESMKMEAEVVAPCAGIVRQVLCSPGSPVAPGQALVILEAT